MRSVSTIIIGGGISGASALHWLARKGESVLLLEAGATLGGVIQSRRNGLGALVEHGPNSIQIGNDRLLELIQGLDIADRVITASDAAVNRYILRDGGLVAVPAGPGDFLRTALFTLSGKLRLAREPFVAAKRDGEEESVAAFIRRRLGREALDYAVNPFVSGIYAGRPEHLSMQYAFPKLHALEQEFGSLTRGGMKRAKAKRREKKQSLGTERPRGMMTFDDGMAVLPRAIETRWREQIVTGATVRRIVRMGRRWQVITTEAAYEAERIVLATAAHVAAELTAGLDGELASALRAIEYPPLATCVSVYGRDSVLHPLDGFGLLIPEVERRPILGVIFSSTLFPGRAPDGTVALTTFIGGARQPELALRPDDEIAHVVHRELQRLLGISAAPRSFDLHRWPRAIPQYNIGHGEILAAIERAEGRLAGLHLLGNYRGGVSVGDCVQSAADLADRLLAGREMERGDGDAVSSPVVIQPEREFSNESEGETG